jgi:cyanophycin synthetase
MRKPERNDLLNSAFSLDRAGREAEAIPIYRKAIRAGLQGDDLRDAMVCLASSLRSVGKLTEAQRILVAARGRFAGDPVVILFLALVEHDLGHASKAVRQLADLYLSQSSDRRLAKYDRVLRRKFHGARKSPSGKNNPKT